MRTRHIAFLLTICLVSGLAGAVSAAEAAGKGFPLRAPGSPAPATAQAVSTILPSPASAVVPATAPAPAQNYENQPLLFANPERRQARSGGYAMPSVWPALLSVAAVCLIFGGILYVMKKYVPGHRQLFSHPSMEILGRTHLDQKRYVSLLRVGKRIVVVGVSPDEMTPLSEITDDDEITAIMEVARPKTEHGLTIFQRLFQRQVLESDAAETAAVAAEKARQLEDDAAALRKRVQETIRRDEPAARHLDRVG